MELGGNGGDSFQSPVLGVFLCFLISVGFNRGVDLNFQSPVLGVFLCFLSSAREGVIEAINFQSPVLGVFLCFLFMFAREYFSFI